MCAQCTRMTERKKDQGEGMIPIELTQTIAPDTDTHQQAFRSIKQ